MTHGYRITYLKWLANRGFNTADRNGPIAIWLYHDATDDLAYDESHLHISTEPDGYTKPTVTFGSVDVQGNDRGATLFLPQVTYDVTGVDSGGGGDSTECLVDSFGMVAELETDAGMENVLIGTGGLREEVDLADMTGNWTVRPTADFITVG